ncbi:uncharacterized protein LOC136062762 [Quercus suber]|uniref:uncharacterized protein LOC136062762 n=1 Tax=Quercus suber TaxID=58331 RepID=UPI0032DF9C45
MVRLVLLKRDNQVGFLGYKRATRRHLRLINRESLDRILRSEAPKCVIRAKDPRLHRISIVFEGFIVPESTPIPEGEPFTEPSPEATLSIGASSSRSIPQKVREKEKEKEKEAEGEEEEKEEEEEGEEEEEEEEEEEDISGGLVELSGSADEFEVFDRP